MKNVLLDDTSSETEMESVEINGGQNSDTYDEFIMDRFLAGQMTGKGQIDLRIDNNNNLFKDKGAEDGDASSTESLPIRRPRVTGRNVIGNSDDSEDEGSNSAEDVSSGSSDNEYSNKSKGRKQPSKPLSRSVRAKPSTSRAISDDCISISSDSDFETTDKTTNSETDEEERSTRKIRPLLEPHQLAEGTKRAQKEEDDRFQELQKKRNWLNDIIASQMLESEGYEDEDSGQEVILDYDSKKGKNIVVHKDIVKQLKPHQVDGIKFMYDCCYGSVDTLKRTRGSGCILAHCMGLGKTLQVICEVKHQNRS